VFVKSGKVQQGVDPKSFSGEDIIGAIAETDADSVLSSFKPSTICPKAAQSSVDVALEFGRWFEVLVSTFSDVHYRRGKT
jgi:hypothetical protein